jgi:hypothetical protein
MNTPLPVTGSVNAVVTGTVAAQQSGNWNVGINGMPTVNANISNATVPVSGNLTATVTNNIPVVNPADMNNNPVPLTIVVSDEALRTPVGARCNANVTDGSCTLYNVPGGSRLVIESLAVSVTRITTGVHPSETFFLVQTDGNAYAEHLPLFQQGSDAFGDYLTGNNTTRMYADPNSSVVCRILFDGPTNATSGLLTCELSGHLVAGVNR